MEDKKRFRPHNGTEGMDFIDQYCSCCIYERWMHHQDEDKEEDKCGILTKTYVYKTTDPEYPDEWTYDNEGKPVCTAWQHWDWGNDEDGWNEPPEDTPIDPNQLVMFSFDEKLDELIEEKELTKEGAKQ